MSKNSAITIIALVLCLLGLFTVLIVGSSHEQKQGDNYIEVGEWVREEVSQRVAKVTFQPPFGHYYSTIRYLNGQEEQVKNYEIRELSENETTTLLRWFAESAPSFDAQVRMPRKDP